MSSIVRNGVIFSVIAALAFFIGAPQAGAKLVPKIDNFIILQDQSGSMYMVYGGGATVPSTVADGGLELDKTKMAMSKKILSGMNDLIPELGYQGSLSMVAPYQQVMPPTVYEKAKLADAIDAIPNQQEIYGRRTPLGMGIHNLDAVMAGLSGRTGIILISDGRENMCTNPVMEAKAIADKYQACFHTISLADTPEGKAVMDQISQLGDCCAANGADLLQDPAALEEFVKCVFYEEAMEEVIVLRGIHFDFDKSNIKAEWVPVLDEAAAILKDNPAINIVIEGHTDSIGTDAYNQALSERRARSVYNFFRQNGIAGSRMTTVGYGESNPIAPNTNPDGTDNPEGRALNRRVELKVVE
ncbi:OmpA family protein [Desulfoferrobacter suflitae]|uniref:OmpA family protein n=1 Tax=Desulfoferrobacter suflitae TaxID=2865782 RepID=UPI002164478F|nr:OmpA family protein [Desulfoferrobacter suflitae]MCK8602209.1 OmpA family protein [Desulfoferrobacter suflitae]